MTHDSDRIEACLAFCEGILTEELVQGLGLNPPLTALKAMHMMAVTIQDLVQQQSRFIALANELATVQAQAERRLSEELGINVLN